MRLRSLLSLFSCAGDGELSAVGQGVRGELLHADKWLNGNYVFFPSNCFDMSSN